jgi:hypothetical protein
VTKSKSSPLGFSTEFTGNSYGISGGGNYCRVSCHINTISTGKGVSQGEIPNGREVLEARSADELKPVSLS